MTDDVFSKSKKAACGWQALVIKFYVRYRQCQIDTNEASIKGFWGEAETQVPDFSVLFKAILNGCSDLLLTYESDGVIVSNYFAAIRRALAEREIRVVPGSDLPSLRLLLAWLDFQIVRLNAFKGGTADYLKLYAWLRICYNTSDAASRHFFKNIGLNRDEAMRQIVFSPDGQLRSFFNDPDAQGMLYRDQLVFWFLRRYDLDAARALYDGGGSPHQIGGEAVRRLTPVGLCAALISVFLLLCASGWLYPVGMKFAFDVYAVVSNWNPIIASSQMRVWLVVPYLPIFFLICFSGFWWFLYRQKHPYLRLQRLLPRLAGGVMIGYLPLISSQDLWGWLTRLPPVSSGMLWFSTLALSFFYMYLEARKALEEGLNHTAMRREVWIRAARVCLIGYLHSALLGLLVCEVLGPGVLKGILSENPPPFTVIQGPLGLLIPKAVLLYAPLALFVGILAQLFWEEKTVTEPL